MNDKKIIAIRGGKATPMILNSGDQYDSRFLLYKSEAGKAPYFFIDGFENCNTDPSERFVGKSGILSEGLYGFICTKTKKLDKCLLLFDTKFFDLVKTYDDITEQMIELPSLIPNPNHGGRKVITSDFIHKGGQSEWDWSMGCQTIYGPDYQRFIDNFEMGEKGYYELIRAEFWKAPKWYQGQ
jgi:hypothetical protein